MYMGKYSIRLFPIAQNDLREIVEYLNTLSPKAATEYYNIITEGISGLSDMPQRCPLVKDAQLRLRGYRFLTVKSYIVFYIINKNKVEIRRILYAKRQYENLL